MSAYPRRLVWCPFTWRYSWGWPGWKSGIGMFDYDRGGGGTMQYTCVFGWLWYRQVLWTTHPEKELS